MILWKYSFYSPILFLQESRRRVGFLFGKMRLYSIISVLFIWVLCFILSFMKILRILWSILLILAVTALSVAGSCGGTIITYDALIPSRGWYDFSSIGAAMIVSTVVWLLVFIWSIIIFKNRAKYTHLIEMLSRSAFLIFLLIITGFLLILIIDEIFHTTDGYTLFLSFVPVTIIGWAMWNYFFQGRLIWLKKWCTILWIIALCFCLLAMLFMF